MFSIFPLFWFLMPDNSIYFEGIERFWAGGIETFFLKNYIEKNQ